MSYKPGRRMLRRYAEREVPKAAWHRKERGVWGWRIAHGQRGTRVTDAGGRNAATHAHSMKGMPVGTGVLGEVRDTSRSARRRRVREQIKAKA